jgi:DNA-binding transcriptional ArsR family regulator
MRVDPEQARVFAALGDAVRLALIDRLAREGPCSLGALTAGTAITRQGVTKHLRVLASAGLVRGARDGRRARWELERGPLDDARHQLEAIALEWDGRLERLRAHVEGE